jgi:hypothetical protein
MSLNKMKLLIENWRKFLKESQDSDLAYDYIYRYEDLRTSFAEKISEILFVYQGKNSVSQTPIDDRIRLAAQAGAQIQASEGKTIKSPTQEEINLFRQDAEMLFDAMDADREMVSQKIDDISRKVDKYIDLFINISNESSDESYEGRLQYVQDLVKQTGYEEDPIYSDEQRDFVQSLIVKPLKGAKDPKHPFPVGSVKDRTMKKLGLTGLLQPLRKQFKPTRKGGLAKRSISKYNQALGEIWGSMADLELKDTHEAAIEKLGPVANSVFSPKKSNYEVVIPRGEKQFKRKLNRETTEYIPVSEFMKDEHQFGSLHYFNPQLLRGNVELAEEAANELQDQIQTLLNQLKTATDDMEKRILRGQIDKLKLERNILRKRVKMLRKDMAMYRQGFENRLEGMDGALPIPKRYGTAQYSGYAQSTGFRNLTFGGAQANIFKDTGVKDRTTEDEDDVLRILDRYLEVVGGELPNPIQNVYDGLNEDDKELFQSMIYRNYIYAQKLATQPTDMEPEEPEERPKSIDSLDDLSMDDLAYFMDEINFADAPVQGTGEDGDVDIDDPANIEWMVGEINKMLQLEEP